MTTDLPAHDRLADEHDTDDWGDPSVHGHMADFASDEPPLVEVHYAPGHEAEEA